MTAARAACKKELLQGFSKPYLGADQVSGKLSRSPASLGAISAPIPSVTLLGHKEDWQLIYRRLDKLETFGAEPSQFCKVLRPVISRFVRSFDEPTSEDIISFWQRIAHYSSMGSGPSYYSGWITAFCFWDQGGMCLYKISHFGEPREALSWERDRFPSLKLDGVSYHRIESDKVPPGYSSVPVKVNDNGFEFDSMMVAGSVGINCISSGDEPDKKLVALDTVSAETGWWIFERQDSVKDETSSTQ